MSVERECCSAESVVVRLCCGVGARVDLHTANLMVSEESPSCLV